MIEEITDWVIIQKKHSKFVLNAFISLAPPGFSGIKAGAIFEKLIIGSAVPSE